MADPKRIIVVSDLHLGRGFEQDDFRDPGENLVWRDRAWLAFCKSVKNAVGDDRTLVILNGDIIDMWEIAHESELDGPGAAAAITARVNYPANTPQREADATAIGIWQIEQACDHHEGFVRGLKTLLAAPKISIRYHYGNHDHGMVNPALQRAFRDILGADANSESKLSFGFHYRSESLKSYIEHGNQFAGDDSRFEDVEDWRHEASGYYALRYIWNRFQHRYAANKPSTMEALSFVIRVLRRSAKSQQQKETFQFVIDYFMALDSGVIPRKLRIREFPYGIAFDAMYSEWTKADKPALADDYFRELMQATLAETEPETEKLPGEIIDPALQDDRYTQGLMNRFFEKKAPFPKLQFTKDRLLSIGHTHRPGRQMLFDDSFRRNVYVNSGTWTRDLALPTYVSIAANNGQPEMSLLQMK